MTTYTIPSVPAAPRVGFGRIVNFARALRMRLRTDHALNSLDDHLMRDIGLPPRENDAHVNLLRLGRGPW